MLPENSIHLEPIPLPPAPAIGTEPINQSVLTVAYTAQQQAIYTVDTIHLEWLTPNRVKSEDTKEPNKRFYSTDEQKEIAKDLGLKVTGNKRDVYERILEKLREAGRA